MAPVDLNIVCFRFNPGDRDEAALNALNQEILLRLHESGVAAPSYTTLRGRYALRAAITNHRSRREDFDILVREVHAHRRGAYIEAYAGSRSSCPAPVEPEQLPGPRARITQGRAANEERNRDDRADMLASTLPRTLWMWPYGRGARLEHIRNRPAEVDGLVARLCRLQPALIVLEATRWSRANLWPVRVRWPGCRWPSSTPARSATLPGPADSWPRPIASTPRCWRFSGERVRPYTTGASRSCRPAGRRLAGPPAPSDRDVGGREESSA